jgi:hypothetical protein
LLTGGGSAASEERLAGLYSAASKRQPSGGSIGAIIRPRIEGNRRAWGSLTNSVDDSFE